MRKEDVSTRKGRVDEKRRVNTKRLVDEKRRVNTERSVDEKRHVDKKRACLGDRV
jgi:hypothetical protein